ncbi:MAG: hypothetical protein OJF59_001148 [Cytophagales bacterium]|nr:MAG: hypothetical protein OJF59_001148 [Cytophagales bacterium]
MVVMTDRLRIERYNNKDIIFVDYRGLKEKEMIELVMRHQKLTEETRLPFLADFHETFATPGYMLHAKEFVKATRPLINKGALLGIDIVKAWILKGILLTYGVNYKSFPSKEDAIEFLTE